MVEKSIQPQDKYVLRFPDGMRGRLKDAAEANNRSMNAEIVHRLERSFFPDWPRVPLPQPFIDRAMTGSGYQRESFEVALMSMAVSIFPDYFPDVENYIEDISKVMWDAIANSDIEDKDTALAEAIYGLSELFLRLGVPRKSGALLKLHQVVDDEGGELIGKAREMVKRYKQQIE